MIKGNILQSFFVFFLIVMALSTFIMSAAGWTGIRSNTDNNFTAYDSPDANKDAFIDNMIGLLSYQSDYLLFNLFLTISYIIVLAFIVELVWI